MAKARFDVKKYSNRDDVLSIVRYHGGKYVVRLRYSTSGNY